MRPYQRICRGVASSRDADIFEIRGCFNLYLQRENEVTSRNMLTNFQST